MTDAITRCPKCKTSFRVNADHLKTARGAVRCGSCLTIFNAKENIIEAAEHNKNEQPASPSKKEEQAPAKPTENDLVTDNSDIDDDDILISDEMNDGEDSTNYSEGFDENVFIAHGASKSELNLFERRIKDISENENPHTEADESWALDLIDDDSEPEEIKLPTNATLKPKSENEAEPSLPFQVIEEDLHEDNDTNALDFDEEILEAALRDEHSHSDRPHKKHIKDQDQLFPAPETPFEDEDSIDFFDIEPEPLELHVQSHTAFWQSNYFWFALSILAALTVIFQLAYFNFEKWSKQQNYRPYYVKACNVLSCTLPVLQDLNKVRIENMLVMDHPKQANSLLVDATLVNQASFEQHFPSLTLFFTNNKNETISEYRFTPKQYVGGEMAGKSLMPVKHPIHITLEIADPGPEAINYQIVIVKP